MSTEPKIIASPKRHYVTDVAGTSVFRVVKWIADTDRLFRRTQAQIDRLGTHY